MTLARFVAIVLLVGASGMGAGCRTSTGNRDCFQPEFQEIQAAGLAGELTALDSSVSPEESLALAQLMVRESLQLKETYHMVRPALLHNILVNAGIRDRGLCWHWMEDLRERSAVLKLRTLELRHVCAHPGSRMREHNALAAGNHRIPREKWVVLDSWRYAGCLYWSRLKDDKYPWQFMPFPQESPPDPPGELSPANSADLSQTDAPGSPSTETHRSVNRPDF